MFHFCAYTQNNKHFIFVVFFFYTLCTLIMCRKKKPAKQNEPKRIPHTSECDTLNTKRNKYEHRNGKTWIECVNNTSIHTNKPIKKVQKCIKENQPGRLLSKSQVLRRRHLLVDQIVHVKSFDTHLIHYTKLLCGLPLD